MSRVVAAISDDPDRGVIRNFSQGSGAVSRVIVGFLFRFELAVRLAEITEVWPLWFEGFTASSSTFISSTRVFLSFRLTSFSLLPFRLLLKL